MSSFNDTLADLLSAPSALHLGLAMARLQATLGIINREQAALALCAVSAVQQGDDVLANLPLREALLLLKEALRDIQPAPALPATEWPSALLEAFGEESLRALVDAPTNIARLAELQKLHGESPALAFAPREVVRDLLDEACSARSEQ